MAVMMIGANHQKASIEFLECLAIEPARINAALKSFLELDYIDEAVFISTCNRKEVYVSTKDLDKAYEALKETIIGFSGMPESHTDSLTALAGEEAARHLFRVACGLDSMIVGEQQILGQVRDAMTTALDAQSAGAELNRLFREAIHVGRTVRQKTSISEGSVSTVSAALVLAREQLEGKKPAVLIHGAGHIGGLAARTLAGVEGSVPLNPQSIVVANRTIWKAEDLAEKLSAKVPDSSHRGISDEEVDEVLATCDLLVTSTEAVKPIFSAERIARVRKDNPNKLTIVDLAVPRDVEPDVAELENVHLIGIDELRYAISEGPSRDAILEVEGFVEEACDEFVAWSKARSVEPTIRSLRMHVEQICESQLNRHKSKFDENNPEQMAALEALTRGIANQILHDPTVRLKEAATKPNGENDARTLAHLFGLDMP